MLLTQHLFPVPPVLSACVQRIEALEGAGATHLPFFADGLPGLVFLQCRDGAWFNETHCPPPVFLYGQTVAPIALRTAGAFRMLVFFLQPEALSGVFKVRPTELTGTCLDLRLLHLPVTNWYDAWLNAGCLEEQVREMSRCLVQLLEAKQSAPDPATVFALRRLQTAQGRVSLRELQQQVCLTERTFERRFERLVGITPRLYARICRFQAVYRQLPHHRFGELTDLAYHLDFADQSHLIRTVREFTGLSPLQLKKQLPLLAG